MSKRVVKTIYNPSTEDVHISGNGAQLIAVLCFVANPPGVVYMGEGCYLLDTKVVAHAVGFASHGAERLHRALRAMLRTGIIVGINYAKLNTGTEDPRMCTVQLPPLVDNFGTRKASPKSGRLGEEILALYKSAVGEEMAISQMEHALHQAREQWADVAYIADAEWQNGFFNPHMFAEADSLLARFKKHGMCVITSRNMQHDRKPGEKKRWVEFKPVNYTPEIVMRSLKSALTQERRLNEYLKALPDRDPSNENQELFPDRPPPDPKIAEANRKAVAKKKRLR